MSLDTHQNNHKAPPQKQLDFSDVSAFLTVYLAGCP